MGPACDPKLIFDIGMDTCQDTAFYLRKGFKVVGVDANPAVCADAARRFASEIRRGQLVVVCRAISETRAALPFYVCTSASMLSTADPALRRLQEERYGHTFQQIAVEGATVGDLIAEHGVPYFAKVDIEGYDRVCLAGFLSIPGRPAYLSTELDLKAVWRHIALLKRLGYRRFALVGQASVPSQRPPTPAREGRHVEHSFDIHSSGLFGRELPAGWMGLSGLRLRCLSMQAQYALTGALRRLEAIRPLAGVLRGARARLSVAGQWYDIHATY